MQDKYKIKVNEKITIFPLSDWHLGTIVCNVEFIDHCIDYILSIEGIVIIYLLGDLIDCAKLRRGNSAYKQIWSVNQQIRELKKRLKRLIDASNIIIRICVPGNHDAGFKIEDFDLIESICESLNIEYTGQDFEIDCKGEIINFIQGADFVDKIWINNKPIKIYIRHGHGKAKRLDLAMGKTLRETQKKDADILCEGHNHRLEDWHDDIKTSIDEGKLKKRYYIFTGHFLSYPGSYAADMGLDPLPEGFMEIKIKIVNKKLDIEPIKHFIDKERPDLWKL